MKIKPYLSTAAGELLLTHKRKISNGDKLKLVLYTNESIQNSTVVDIEILNPFGKKIVSGKVPKLDTTLIATMEVVIQDNWIGGRYIVNVLNLSRKIVTSCEFIVKPSNALIQYLTERATRPYWLMYYKVSVGNRTEKPIGNFSAFIALPMNIQPFQMVKELKLNPSDLKLSSDTEGNQWVHTEISRINPGEVKEIGYTAKIQSNPLLLSDSIEKSQTKNPYSKSFLEPYLKAEPHIESNHIEIMKLASSIKTTNPISFVRRAIRIVNRKLTYKIQSGEFGAAYAIEKGEGDCTEYAALFVALCRAKGIPARTNAGFVLAEDWERHATAEFMVGGRWIPVDVTGQRGSDIFMGHLPANIIVTRGNWMGGTLAQEVSYRYQILDQRQKLDINVDWKISMINKNAKLKEISTKPKKKSIKIIESKVSTSNSIKIIDSVLEDTSNISKVAILDRTLKLDKPIRLPNKPNNQPDIVINVDIPDLLKSGVLKNHPVVIRNNTNQQINGCFEIRSLNDGIIKLLGVGGVKLAPETEAKFKSNISLESTGINELEIVFMNRIGRILAKKGVKTSIY